jgi:hypothetical protein
MAWNRFWTPEQDIQNQWDQADPIEQNNMLLAQGRNEHVGNDSINPQWTRYFDLLARRGAHVGVNAGRSTLGEGPTTAGPGQTPLASSSSPGADVQVAKRQRSQQLAGLLAALGGQ